MGFRGIAWESASATGMAPHANKAVRPEDGVPEFGAGSLKGLLPGAPTDPDGPRRPSAAPGSSWWGPKDVPGISHSDLSSFPHRLFDHSIVDRLPAALDQPTRRPFGSGKKGMQRVCDIVIVTSIDPSEKAARVSAFSACPSRLDAESRQRPRRFQSAWP